MVIKIIPRKTPKDPKISPEANDVQIPFDRIGPFFFEDEEEEDEPGPCSEKKKFSSSRSIVL